MKPMADVNELQDKAAHWLFEEQVERTADALAISFECEQISYADLNARANQIAHALIRMGLKLNQTVAIMLEDGPQQIATLFGVFKAGGVILCLDLDHPANRLNYILEEATPRYLIAGSACRNRHQAVLRQLAQSNCDLLMWDSEDVEAEQTGFGDRCYTSNLLDTCPITNPNVDVSSADPVYIVYTSSSTGKPKGIVQSHRSFCQYIEWQSRQFGIQAPQRFAQWASIAYDAGYRQIFGTLCFGATLCMAPSSVRYNPSALVKWVREERITILNVVPSFCWQIIGVLKSENKQNGRHPLPNLEQLLLTGEVLPVDLAYTWLNFFRNAPKLFNLYGPSECILATYYPVEKVRPDQRSISVGRAIDGREILILDNAKKLCRVGVRGELYIRSQYLTLGYFQRPEQTATRFIQNPLHDDFPDPVYQTGDMGSWLSNGNIEFYGRVDNQVKLRGIRIELEDIESVLQRHQGVRSSAVVVHTVQRGRSKLVAKERQARENRSEGDQQMLVAFYTAENQISRAELQSFLASNLPSQLIPQQFIRLDELPLNVNRKLDRKALSKLDILRPELRESYVSPRSPLESRIVEIWQDVLAIDRVGINDSFFGLGGNSLLAMQVLNRIRHSIDFKFSFRDLFENQTIAKLVESVQQPQEAKPQLSPVVQVASQRTSYPLTLAQQGLWYLWHLEPNSPYYTGQGTIHLRGTISLPVLHRAWQALLERHVILRVRFDTEEGKPVQVYEERPAVNIPLADLTHLPKTEQWHTIEKEAKEQAQYALQLDTDPLLKAKLFKLSENEYQIALTFHEIILDLWGLSIMVRDLGALYQCFAKGEESPLRPPELQFSDYAVWENKHIQRHIMKAQEAYWRKELSGELPVLSLPRDRSRPLSPSYRGLAKSVTIDAQLSRQLKALGLQEDATLFMTLLAAFNVLLHVYSGQNDLIIGAPIANRMHESAEDLVGSFLNMLPLRTQLGDDPSFIELLRQTKETVTGAITNGDYPFMWMVETLNVVRDPSVSPVFQVMFNMLNLPHVAFADKDIEVAYSELDTGYQKYDLALYAQEHEDQIFLQIAYQTDLFDESTIDSMLKNLVVLLISIVEAPESAISALNMLNDVEKQALLYDFNNTDRDFGNGLSIHQLFEKQVEKTPHKTALIFDDQHLTYAKLNRRANQLARFLRHSGVGPGIYVAICTERSFEMVVGLLGIMKAGGIYVALEPQYPLPRLWDILENTDPSVLLVHKSMDRFDEFSGKKIYIDAEWERIEKEDISNPDYPHEPGNLLNIVYTSSTTGKPKGTYITTDSVLNRLFWMWDAYPFQSDDVAVLQKSYALVAATWELFGALLKGKPTLILSEENLLDSAQFWDKVIANKVSYLLATPALLEGVLQQADLHPGQWSSLRLATTSAEPISPETVARWKKAFPHVPLLNLYGSTECASNVTEYDTCQLAAGSPLVPIGKPLPNNRVFVLNDRLKALPIGATGELCVSGACVARGYLNLPELTAERFVANPFSDGTGSRLYRTGDLVRYGADGNLELIGRKDLQVKIRGFRVELGDVEAVLSQHELVKECVVALYEEDVDVGRLVGYVVAAGELSRSALRRFLRKRLPDYMVPLDFVLLEALPQTPNGKVDRRALPKPNDSLAEGEGDYVAPTSPTERTIAEIWQSVIGIGKVGVYDNFFDLGGHSLMLMKVVYQIEQELGLRLSPSEFIVQTLRQLAACCDRVAAQEQTKRSRFSRGQLRALWRKISHGGTVE